MKKTSLTLLLLAVLCFFSAAAEETVWTLPMDTSPGMPLRKECYLDENTYVDPTIEMRVHTGNMYDTIWWMAEVKIKHPSQLRTMPAVRFTTSARAPGSKLSRRANAVLAANGDYFWMDVSKKGSYVLRQGELYSHSLTGRSDILLIDEAADFHIIHKAQEGDIPEEIGGKKLINALCFGPALVENGKALTVEPDDFMITEKKAARMAICQIGPLHYAVVACSCPSVNSAAMTLQEFANLLGTLGIECAYNLDGGNSTMMFTGDRLINYNSSRREISDIIYFASAWPGEEAP